MRRLLAPKHELSCGRRLWRNLLAGLRERGRGVRESGAFLLGVRRAQTACISSFVLYDDLDPRCLDSGIVHFDGRYFGTLWEICKRDELEVVADVHTHLFGVGQSLVDQAHPMIARAGHIALIVSDLARSYVSAAEVGIHRYLGAKRWQEIPWQQRCAFFYIGL
jgi:hypothetical protein